MDDLFTQSSFRDYLTCKYKYKLKYIDNLSWFQDEFKESFDIGNDFHVIAERYFLNLPNDYIDDGDLIEWFSALQSHFPKVEEEIYLPEYELRYNEMGIKLMARFDLLILKRNEIVIVDWKTNKNKVEVSKKDEDIQTKVYLFLLANCLSLFPQVSCSLDSIKMLYWQPNFSDSKVEVFYSFEKHLKYKDYFLKLIDDIDNSKKNDIFERNKKHCNLCEFNVFCNT